MNENGTTGTFPPADVAKVEEHTFQTTVGGATWTFKAGKLAQLAGGAITVALGDTLLLVTATASKRARDTDFLPLSVDLEEKLYAAGRIPGSFFKREGRPSDVAILTSRLIDRPLRPLFPKSMRHEIQVIATALSSDGQNYLDIPALVGASAALMISDIPFPEPAAGVRVGRIDGNFVINPTADQMTESDLDLRVAGTESAILMVECGAQEIDEATMLKAIRAGHEAMKPLFALQHEMQRVAGKPKRVFELDELPARLKSLAKEQLSSRLEAHVQAATELKKTDSSDALGEIEAEWIAAFLPGEDGAPPSILDDAGDPYLPRHVIAAFGEAHKYAVRERILAEKIRPDGRAPDQIRPLYCEVALAPRTHGSGLFQRGETQVLSLATLGTLGEEQRLDTLRPEATKRFMHHYNFPPYSTGETWFLRGPKRREIGHGTLVEAALQPVLPDHESFPYTIRVVSEALSSNGSTSMASVCASSLALMDAGVPIVMPVAGIAMGLVSDVSSGRNVVLTDIQGMEDHLGDMDFKVAGTEAGITALQMDIKIGGLSDEILTQALNQAHRARMQILASMAAVLPEPRSDLSKFAPRITSIKISTDSIGKLIGPGGKNIRALEADTGVKIDIQEDGTVFIASSDSAAAERAREIISGLTTGPELGKTYTGTVVRTTDFGAFIEVLPGVDGLVHISQLATERVPSVQDVVQVGDEVLVMVTDVTDGKVRLSRRAVLEGWTLEVARQSDAGLSGGGGGRGGSSGGGGGRGDRGARSGGGGRDRR